MARTFKDKLRAMNADLNRDLANMQVKKRVTFHRGTEVHGIGKKSNRYDRRTTKAALRRGDW